MSKNILQVYMDNPIVTNNNTDLMYFGQSPFGPGDDAAMQFSDFAAQFGNPYTASALTKVDDTNVTMVLGGTPATALLQAVSMTLGWAGQLSPARGGTGVNNGTNTLTLAGNLATSGAFAATFTFTGATNVTFPTAGTLATTSQIPSVTPSAMTKVDDTNVTLTLGGTPATSLLQAVSLTLGWTGTLSPARGGTGVNNGTNTLTLGGNLTTSGAFASTFTMTGITTVTFPTSGTLATTSQLPTPAALTKTDDTNVTLTLGGTPATSLLQAVSLTLGWTGQLSVPRGGTGLASATAYAVICGGTTSTGAFQSIASVGTAGQVLTSNGAGALPTMQGVAGTLKSFQIFTSGTAQTYTRPAGITSILVECVGGGGGGGGIDAVASSIGAAGGGGGGGYGRKWYASAASTYTYTVGGGGNGGAAGNNNGSTGTNTTFDTMTANGGGGGQGVLAQNVSGLFVPGGVGGGSTGCDVNGAGYAGQVGTGGLGSVVGGAGGGSMYGGGGVGVYNATLTTSTAGGTGGLYGGGGSGACSFTGTTDRAGGNGAAGIIIVWEFA
jgi:hypothetical protein